MVTCLGLLAISPANGLYSLALWMSRGRELTAASSYAPMAMETQHGWCRSGPFGEDATLGPSPCATLLSATPRLVLEEGGLPPRHHPPAIRYKRAGWIDEPFWLHAAASCSHCHAVSGVLSRLPAFFISNSCIPPVELLIHPSHSQHSSCSLTCKFR